MDAREILAKLQQDIRNGVPIDFRVVREQVHDASETATVTTDRVLLLEIFHLTMDITERNNIAPENLATFQEARLKDYHLLLVREVLIGQNVSIELLDVVTRREIAAGRMDENDSLRQIAVTGIDAPHPTVQELQRIEAERLAAESQAIAKPQQPSGWRSWFGKH